MKMKWIRRCWGIFCTIGVIYLFISLKKAHTEINDLPVPKISKEEARRLFDNRCEEVDREFRDRPEDFDDYAEKGGCLAAKGRWEESLLYYLEDLERRPHSAYRYLGVSNVYYNLGRYREAIHYVRRGISLDRGNPVSHYSLAFLLEKVTEWDEALVEYQQVLRWVKEHGEGTIYANVYSTDHLKRELLQEAIQRLEKKVKEKISEKKTPRVLDKEDQKDQGEDQATTSQAQYANYCKGIEYQIHTMPRDSRRQLAWAFCRTHASDTAGAEAAFLAALEQDAGNPYLYLFIAGHYRNHGQNHKTVSELRRGLGQNRLNPVIQYLLAQAYENIGRFKEARALYQEVLNPS